MGDNIAANVPIPPSSGSVHRALVQAHRALVAELRAAVAEATMESMESEMAEAFNPFAADAKTKSKALQQRPLLVRKEEEIRKAERVHAPESANELAHEFEQRNPELRNDLLLMLRTAILSKGSSAEEILEEALRLFPDPSLADEALEFLVQSLEGEMAVRAQEAKELLNTRFGREVLAGKNIATQARTYAEAGVGTPSELRDLYRDVTGAPRDHNALFHELSDQYHFDKLQEVIEFLLSSMGADLKADGPSIARGKLYRLLTEVRVLQSIMGVYRFFLLRDALINRAFASHDLKRPEDLDFEKLAKTFMKLVEERYPNATKLFRLAKELGLSEEAIMQIIILEQFRDAIREVAPRIYKSMKHRYELLQAIIEALEELEEELDEELTAEEEDDDDI